MRVLTVEEDGDLTRLRRWCWTCLRSLVATLADVTNIFGLSKLGRYGDTAVRLCRGLPAKVYCIFRRYLVRDSKKVARM